MSDKTRDDILADPLWRTHFPFLCELLEEQRDAQMHPKIAARRRAVQRRKSNDHSLLTED